MTQLGDISAAPCKDSFVGASTSTLLIAAACKNRGAEAIRANLWPKDDNS